MATIYWTSGQPPIDIDEKDILNKLTSEDFDEIKNTGTLIIPDNIRYISQRLFLGSFLKYLKLPKSLEYIGDDAFSHSYIERITIPKGLKGIGDSAFNDSCITSIDLSHTNLEYLGAYAFGNCGDLENVLLPDNLETLGVGVFHDTSELKNIKLPNNLKEMGSYCFYESSIEKIDLPKSLEYTGVAVFRFCSKIKSITIPETIKDIPAETFEYCRNLEEIFLPSSLKHIESSAFNGCKNLKYIYYNGSEEDFFSLFDPSAEDCLRWFDEIGVKIFPYSTPESINFFDTLNLDESKKSKRKSKLLVKDLDESLQEKIVKKDNQYQVQSEKGRNMGTYKTKEEAKKRLQQIEYFKHLNEKVEKHDTLNPKLFDENNHLKKEVRDKVLDIVDEFVSGLQEDGVKINIKDIIIVGSNASYNYNDQSDVDVHIRVDTKSLDCPDNLYPLLYSAYRSIFNKKFDISFYGIPVELYIETIDEEPEIVKDEQLQEAQQEQQLVSNGIYSVLKDKWIKEPIQQDIPEIDQEAFNKLFNIWKERYDKLLSQIAKEVDYEEKEKI